MIYADYAYYTDSFYGEMPEDAFQRCATRASDYIDRLTMHRAQDYVILHPDDESVKKACCAAAEQFYMILNARKAAAENAAAGEGEVASESVGRHSVSYRSNRETITDLEETMQKQVSSYLAMTGLLYRGISHVHSAHNYTDYS